MSLLIIYPSFARRPPTVLSCCLCSYTRHTFLPVTLACMLPVRFLGVSCPDTAYACIILFLNLGLLHTFLSVALGYILLNLLWCQSVEHALCLHHVAVCIMFFLTSGGSDNISGVPLTYRLYFGCMLTPSCLLPYAVHALCMHSVVPYIWWQR